MLFPHKRDLNRPFFFEIFFLARSKKSYGNQQEICRFSMYKTYSNLFPLFFLSNKIYRNGIFSADGRGRPKPNLHKAVTNFSRYLKSAAEMFLMLPSIAIMMKRHENESKRMITALKTNLPK